MILPVPDDRAFSKIKQSMSNLGKLFSLLLIFNELLSTSVHASLRFCNRFRFAATGKTRTSKPTGLLGFLVYILLLLFKGRRGMSLLHRYDCSYAGGR